MKNNEIKLPIVMFDTDGTWRIVGSRVVSEAKLEARRRAGMLWFMHKRDQQKDWS